MDKEQHIAEEVEKTLRAFDNDPILADNPFLWTRGTAERHRLYALKKGVPARYGMSMAMLLMLMINLFTLAYYYSWSEKEHMNARLVSALKAEYQVEQTENTF